MHEDGINYDGIQASLYQEFGITKSAANPKTEAVKNTAESLFQKYPKQVIGSVVAGSLAGAGGLAKLVHGQMQEKKKPLMSSMLNPNTALGGGVQTGALMGGALLAAAAAGSLSRTRQNQVYV